MAGKAYAKINGIYLITDDSKRKELVSKVTSALQGGVTVVQYRDKKRPTAEQLAIAIELRQICHRHNAVFIVNDSIDLALNSQADGVHLGQSDDTIATARKLLGNQAIIGISTNTEQLAVEAEQQGADYIGVGSIYPTATKQDAIHIGIDSLKAIRQAVKIPIVAIGGISNNKLPEVIDAGANSAAIISAIMSDINPATAAREMSLQFQNSKPLPHGRVLTIAGSDSGGGAGIQADIKSITLLGSYASSAITALTAQNTHGVSAIEAPSPTFVRQQIEAVLSDIGTDVIKTGMLYSAEIINIIANTLENNTALCVMDPVMIAKGGSMLLQQDAIETFIQRLLPKAYLLTPNVPEAEALTGKTITNLADMKEAAQQLQTMGARNVLIKGGHLTGDPVDLLLYNGQYYQLDGKRIDSQHTHGTGCTTAAVIATLLAQGIPLDQAVILGKQFITEAIITAPQLGGGHGPINHYIAAQKIVDRSSDHNQ